MPSIIPGNPGTIRGALIGLRINGQYVSCETSCEFSFEREMKSASSITSGGWKEFIGGIRGWAMTVNGNLLLKTVGADIKTVLNAFILGDTVELEFRTRGTIAPYLIISGTAFPQSGGITAAGTGKANWTLSFQGTGPFTTDFEEFYLIINAMPAEADYPLIIQEDL